MLAKRVGIWITYKSDIMIKIATNENAVVRMYMGVASAEGTIMPYYDTKEVTFLVDKLYPHRMQYL
jgi:hypothetical protein